MNRLFGAALMVFGACLLAAIYGGFHNQISYSVGSDYFHAFKFRQFRVPVDIHNRFGATLVGVQASWWMGLVIGGPLAVVSLLHPSARQAARAFVRIAVGIVVLALAIGAVSLIFPVPGFFAVEVWVPSQVSDPASFVRAAWLHEVSYGAGAVGLLIGLAAMISVVWRARRR